MATPRWSANGRDLKQLNTITPANVAIGNTFTVTINGKNVTFTATAATVANVTAGLVALLNATTAPPEHQEITWADATTNLTGTAKVAGKPFTQTSSASGGTAALTTAVTTANESRNDVDDVDNWSTGANPAALDEVYVQDTDQGLLYDLGGLSAITVDELHFYASFTGDCGLPRFNTAQSTPFYEYRATEFAISATAIFIGEGVGDGSPRIKLNVAAVACTLNVLKTGTPVDTDDYAVRWRGTNAANVVNHVSGSLGIAVDATELATVATLRVGHEASVASDATVFCGQGVTLATLDMAGGNVTVSGPALGTAGAAFTTGTVTGGTLTIKNGTFNALTLNAGTCYHNGTSNTGTTVYVGSDAVLDFSRGIGPLIITNCTIAKGGTIKDPNKRVTFTNGVKLYLCGLADVTLDLGEHLTLTPSVI